jgi:hypothetical protein
MVCPMPDPIRKDRWRADAKASNFGRQHPNQRPDSESTRSPNRPATRRLQCCRAVSGGSPSTIESAGIGQCRLRQRSGM